MILIGRDTQWVCLFERRSSREFGETIRRNGEIATAVRDCRRQGSVVDTHCEQSPNEENDNARITEEGPPSVIIGQNDPGHMCAAVKRTELHMAWPNN